MLDPSEHSSFGKSEPRQIIWPSGCVVIFEQHYADGTPVLGQVSERFLDARYFTMNTAFVMEIRNGVGVILSLVNFDKVLLIAPLETVGPNAGN